MLKKNIMGMILLATIGLVAGVLGAKWLDNSQTSATSNIVIEKALCAEHNIPVSQCSRCNPELIPEFKAAGDWCSEHNLPETQCDLCGRSLEETEMDENAGNAHAANADWCAEHRVPESECTQCQPELVEKFKSANDWCGEHNLPESHCRLCHPDLKFPQEESAITEKEIRDEFPEVSIFFPKNAKDCATNGAIIQFASSNTAERAGLTIEPAISAHFSPKVEALAEIIFDETRTTVANTIIPASVVRWLVEPGQAVERGQVIAEVESSEMPILQADFLEANAEYLVSEQERKRKEQLLKGNLLSAGEYELAVAAAQAEHAHLIRAEGILRSAGLSASELESILSQQKIGSKFGLKSPSQGILIERQAALGDLLPAGTAMAIISDPQLLWMVIQVKDRDIKRIKRAQRVEFAGDGNGLARCLAEVIWVPQFLDSDTRTAEVRARLISNSEEVRPGDFGQATIHTEPETGSVLVPKDAVQWEGCCNVVFVAEAQDRFRPRKIRFEKGDADHYRILEGLSEGEMIVVHGSYLLKTELRKSSIGAGCCGIEPTS